MANYERDHDVHVFDGGEDDEDIEGSRLPLLIVIALLVLAAFGAVVWLAYQRGVAQGHSEAPRIIAAEPGPAKVAPTNPGGTPTPYTGLKIYQQPAPDGADAAAPSPAATPPPAAKPVPTAKPTPATTAAAPATAGPAATPKPTATAMAAPPAAKPAPAAPATKPAAAPAKPTTVATAAPLKLTPAPEENTVAPSKPAAPAPVKAATATPPAAPAPAPVPSGVLLQIGSYKSQAEAEAAWTAYKARHASLVGSMSSSVQSADLGARGTWYRLRIAAGSHDEAAALCQKLKAEGGACILAH